MSAILAQVDPPLPYGGGARGRPGGPAVGSSRPAGWTSLRAGEGLSPPPKPQDHSGPDISISLRFTAMVGTVPPSSQKRSAGRTPFPNLGKFVTRGDRDCNLHLRPLPRGMAPPLLPRKRPAGRTPLPSLGKFVTKGDRDCNLHLGDDLPEEHHFNGKFVTRGDRDCNLHPRLLPRGLTPPPLGELPNQPTTPKQVVRQG